MYLPTFFLVYIFLVDEVSAEWRDIGKELVLFVDVVFFGKLILFLEFFFISFAVNEPKNAFSI